MKFLAVLTLLMFLTACATADQNSLRTEDPSVLSKAEKSPLLKAELLQKHKLYAEAEKILSAIIETAQPVDPASVERNYIVKIAGTNSIALSYLYYSRAGCWYHLKRFDKAWTDYAESYRLEGNPERLYDIGYCMYQEGAYDKSIEKFDEYIVEAHPNRQNMFLALHFRSFAVFAKGDMEEGIRDLKKLQVQFPEWKGSLQSEINQAIEKKKEMEKKSKSGDESE